MTTIRLGWTLLATLAVLGGVACARKDEPPAGSVTSPPAAKSGQSAAPAVSTPSAVTPDTPAAPPPPATLTDVNLVATDVGGGIEELTGGYGPGFFGRRLVDGAIDPPW